MRTQQRSQESQQQQRKRKKGRDSEQESGLLNISEHLQTYVREEDQSCVEKVKSSFYPLLLSLVLALLLGVIVYRYFWLMEHPKKIIEETVVSTPYLHKEVPYEQNQSPADQLSQLSKQQQKHSLQHGKSIIQETKMEEIANDEFPNKLWYFDRQKVMKTNNEHSYFKDYSNNWQYYSKSSNIEVQGINIENFKNYIKNQQIIQAIQILNSIQIDPLMKENIIQTVIMLTLLQNNGGIIIGGDIILTQPLDSFNKKVQQNPNSSFFYYNSSSNKEQFKIDLDNYFIMARKSSPVINELLFKILLFLQPFAKQKQSQPVSSQEWIKKFSIEYGNVFNLILKSNQSLKNSIYSLGNQNDIKIQNNLFLNLTHSYHFKYFYSLQQLALQQMVGPINLIVQFPSKLYNSFIVNSSEQQKNQILKNSFIYRHLISTSPKNSHIKPVQIKKSLSEQWKLPKVIWTVFNKNHMSDPLNEVFLQNIYQKSKLTGFQFVILTESNIKAIFSFQQMKEIQQILKRMSQNQNQNAMNSIKQDKILISIIKLKVLHKYGGVFIDHEYFLLDNLQWLSKIPENYHIFNKKQHHFPDSFMFHNHGDFKWRININSGQKQAEELIYSTKFIAANKQSHLIKDWLAQVNKNSLMTKENLQNKFQSQCQIRDWKIEDIFEVTFKCMMIKNRMIDPTETTPQALSSNAYNLWSINNLFAGQKMDIISKVDESLCYTFDSSVIDFKEKFGSLGYISPVQTKGSKKQIDIYLKKQHHDSIFNQLFTERSQKQLNGLKLWDHARKDYIKDVINKVQKVVNK